MSGTLTMHVLNATYVAPTEMSGLTKARAQITIQGNVFASELMTSTHTQERVLNFDTTFIKSIDAATQGKKVLIELMSAENVQLAKCIDKVSSLCQGSNLKRMYELKNKSGQHVSKMTVQFSWKAADATATTNPPANNNTLSNAESKEFCRPALLQVSYYFDASTRLMTYSKSVRVLSPFIALGENSLNFVLSKLHINNMSNTSQVHEALVPVLLHVDQHVDATLSSVLDSCVRTQHLLLEKKDAAVVRLQEASTSTWNSIDHAKEVTVEQLEQAKNKSVDGLVHAKDRVVRVTDSTWSTMASMSSSTYQSVSEAAYYVLSHVPIVGKKIMT